MFETNFFEHKKFGGDKKTVGGHFPRMHRNGYGPILPVCMCTTLHTLPDAVEKRARGFMIPSQMASLAVTQLFCAGTLASFSFAKCTCVAIFFLRWPTEHVASKLLYRSKSMNYQERK